jgi:hypothetical protein
MKIFSQLFSVFKEKDTKPMVNDIVREIDPLINRACIELFAANSRVLLQKPFDYIVPAVWGAKKDAQPDEAQKEMFRQIQPVEDSIMRLFDLKKIGNAQEFGIRYLIKGLFIARILHMIELSKNLSANQEKTDASMHTSLQLH